MSPVPDPPEKFIPESLTDGATVDWSREPTTAPRSGFEPIARVRDGSAADAGPPEEPAPVLRAGDILGGYRIEGELGSGGMGVVYLARDPRLDRDVAIKMLSAQYHRDGPALARLAREARLLASIDHPGIAIIHAMEEDGEHHFLVMERVRGVSLAQRLKAGPLQLDEAIAVGTHIAEALLAAHESGVIHRDLKPSNIMLTARGRVKVLDFGVARPARIAPASGDIRIAMYPGETLLAGTPGYMSPERLRGEGDQRVDVFAFGCVLFECLTGARAFPGARADEVLAAVLGAEPRLDQLPPHTPESLRQLLAGCLTKEPERRLAGMEPVLAVLRRASGAAAAPRPSSSTPHNLPAERTRFVGREVELAECEVVLHAGERQGRLLTVIGSGGAGKTRLALRLAERGLEAHPDGVWFVDLSPLMDPARVPLAVASALGVREQSGVPLSHTLAEHLQERRALLVLDNCEHVLEASRSLTHELRGTCARLAILATSREPLELDGERVYALPPLPTPSSSEPDEPAGLLRHASVALFVDRAQLATPDFALDPSTAPAVKEICRAMDGLPLAIELAAARVRVLSVNEIAARLDRLMALLRAPSGSMADRHTALHATLEWSVEALSPEEQRAFRALSVFANGWNLAEAEAVLERDEFDALDQIDALVSRSLAITETRAHETRYRFLEPVRQFAAERLAKAGETAGALIRMVDYVVAMSEQAGPALLGPEQSQWLDRLGLEHENIQAALDACQRLAGRAESALRITGSLWRYWHIRGHLRAGADAIRQALALPGAGGAGVVRAGALYAAGALIAFDMEGQKRARESFEEALALFRAAGDDFGVARCLTGLGAVASARREFAAGTEFLQEAQAIYRKLGDRRGLAVTLNNLGAAAWNQGELERAADSISEALDLARVAGDLGNVAQLSVALALIDTRLGRLESGRGHLRECLSTLATLGARHSSAAGALLASAELADREGRLLDVARWLGAADHVLERLGLVFDHSDVWWKERANCWNRTRAKLGPERADAEYRSGRSLDRDQALRLALETLDASSDASSGRGA